MRARSPRTLPRGRPWKAREMRRATSSGRRPRPSRRSRSRVMCSSCASGYYEYPAGSGICVDDPCIPDVCNGNGACDHGRGQMNHGNFYAGITL